MLIQPPRPFDPARASRTFESLAEGGFVPDEADRALLEGAFGNSPFLARLAIREQATLKAILSDGPDAAVAFACELALSAVDSETEAVAMVRLRTAKRRAAFAIALADIAGRAPVRAARGGHQGTTGGA
jgi:glutamate-ammonia-ligase adenylyltransferase